MIAAVYRKSEPLTWDSKINKETTIITTCTKFYYILYFLQSDKMHLDIHTYTVRWLCACNLFTYKQQHARKTGICEVSGKEFYLPYRGAVSSELTLATMECHFPLFSARRPATSPAVLHPTNVFIQSMYFSLSLPLAQVHSTTPSKQLFQLPWGASHFQYC